MNAHWNGSMRPAMSRRELLRAVAAVSRRWPWPGFWPRSRGPSAPDPRNPLAPRPPHFPARAKRVIFLFMHGGPSQVDTFDYKPLLERDHGKPLPFAKPRVVSGKTGNLLRSPFKFQRYGQSGIAVSELFPHLAGSRRRPLHDQLDARLELAARRGAARAAHRQRYVRPPEHGLVDHLRPGDREPGPAGLHHDLPEPEPRRREQLELGLPAGRLPGDADRQHGRPVRPGQDSVHHERVDARGRCNGSSST